MRVGLYVISVYHKDRLSQLLSALQSLPVKLFSTGGTARVITSLGVDVTLIEDLTQSPSMLGGRVKTLHPKVFGGILARRDHSGDLTDIARADLLLFDWVIVDLYPFSQSVRAQAGHEQIIEHIDIGGVSLIRAAAKNYRHTLVISNNGQIDGLVELIKNQKGHTDLATRRQYAVEAFTLTARYDADIMRFLDEDSDSSSLFLLV